MTQSITERPAWPNTLQSMTSAKCANTHARAQGHQSLNHSGLRPVAVKLGHLLARTTEIGCQWGFPCMGAAKHPAAAELYQVYMFAWLPVFAQPVVATKAPQRGGGGYRVATGSYRHHQLPLPDTGQP